MKKYFVPTLLSLLALLWLVISLRVEFLPLAILLFSFAFAPFVKKKTVWAVCAFFVVAIYPLSPIAITFKTVEGPPKIIGYCNIGLAGGMETARENQRNGNCVIASDIDSGFEPMWFIVW